MSRPPIYTPELAAKICARIAEGESLRAICRDDGFPARSVVHEWIVNNHEGFTDQYARAKEAGIEAIAEGTLDIADDGLNDTYRDEQGNVRTDQDVIARSKLRVDTRKWYLSKIAPKKYGDKQAVELTGADNGPVQVEHKADRIAELMALAATRKSKQDEDLDGLV